MFKKIVSNLPFNPGLIQQLGFYAERLKKEDTIRRTGVILIVLALFVQGLAFMNPATPTIANSTNDLINGGFSSKEEAVAHCTSNTRNYKKIMSYYGIDCDDIAQSVVQNIKSTDHNRQLFSMGYRQYGKAGETPVSIPEVGTVWLRYLWSWDTGAASTYKALVGTSKNGTKFMILFNCGNLVFIGIPTPPERCPYNSTILASNPQCIEPCPVAGKQHLPKNSPQCFEPCPYNANIPANSSSCFEPCPIPGKEALPKSSGECFEPCPYNSSIPTNSPSCKPCEEAQTREDKTACLVLSKAAANISQGISDANGTTAQAGEIISYSLKVKNIGKEKIPEFIVQENISDILDYSDVVDLSGGSLDSNGIVSWPKSTIAANEEIVKIFTVKIKTPIPQTPISSSDPGHFDNLMTNIYGNTVSVKLPPSIVKTTEVITRTLPNTGPGQSLFIISLITIVGTYFLARSMLLRKEMQLLRQEYAAEGAM